MNFSKIEKLHYIFSSSWWRYGKEERKMTDFEKELEMLDEVETLDSPACIIGPFFFVSD